ncbi:MAG: arsenate reductase family protein [Bacteroidia bacterium]
MSNKLFYLKTCSTNQKIMAQFNLDDFELREIKSEPITESEINEMYKLAGSYEAIFSRRSMKYKAWGLKDKTLTEADFKDLILKEYTFLKRPVIIVGNQLFAGNAKKVVDAALEASAL